LTGLGLLLPPLRSSKKVAKVVKGLIEYLKKAGPAGLKTLKGIIVSGGKDALGKVIDGANALLEYGIKMFQDLSPKLWGKGAEIVKSSKNLPNILKSASRPARAGSKDSRALQALKKKVDRGDAAFRGLSKDLQSAEKVIKDIINSKDKIVKPSLRNGINYIDIFDKKTGRGVRLIDGAFDTFINL
jgi:hypothetical protein